MNRKDGGNKSNNQKGYQDRQQDSQGRNQGYQNRNNTYNNSYNDRPRNQGNQGGYKNNYEENKQQNNARPATSTTKQNPENVPETNFREEFKEFFEEVKQFEIKMDAFKKSPKSSDGYYYLLSNKAMKEWKEYLDHPNIVADKKPYISISRKPNKVNEDLVLEDKSYLQFSDKQDPCAVVLKPDLEKDKDFIIINEDLWNFFKGKYGGLEIKRRGAVDEQGNISLTKTMHVATLIIMYSSYLKNLESNKNDPLRIRKLQVPLEFTVKSFKSQMAKIFNKLAIFKYNIESGCIRIWRMDPKFSTNEEFRAYLHDCCVKSKSYDYQIQFDGQLLDREPSAYLEEINPDLKDTLLIEINQPGKLWIFFNEYVKACKKCVFCGKIDFLDYECICGQVAYCSEHCKYSDKGAHVKKCEKAYDSDENKEVATVTNPIDGLAGLENLGNTCYMNSAIQCLSNIKELTEHFISQKYKPEINEQNPLGTKGKIVRKYAYLVKKLWLDNKREFAPYSLKLAVSKFQTMFHGQNQHDSQEFLFYLLDTIHEDLNRVIHKPLTDPIEANNRSDLEVGKESWEVFLKRNQSIVVDLMYGQFKSTIECLACKSVSKSFESFSICSIPIPNQKEIEVFLVHENYKKKPYRILLKYPDNKHTLKDLKSDLAFLLDKAEDSIQLAVGDRNFVQPQYNLDVTTYEFSHQLGKNYLFAFELTQEELKIPQNRRVFIGFQTLKADAVYEPKESMGVVKMIAVDGNMTNKDVHLRIFSKYRFMFDERWPYKSEKPYDLLSLERACDEAFARSKHPIYEVVITRVGIEKVQEGVLEYNDDKFSSVLRQFENPEKELVLHVEWKYIPSFIELEYFRSFIKFDPYKAGINNKTNDEKRFIDISDCLASSAEPEELDENNAWYCKNCGKHQNAKKVLELYKIPQVFIMHLKRFKTGDNTRWNRTESKITDMITFPVENFDLSPYVINPHLPSDYFGKETDGSNQSNGSKKLEYDLIGVIHHIGNLNSGHYIAHCKNIKTGEWHAYDDERIRKIENLEEIVTSTAYILFYRRK